MKDNRGLYYYPFPQNTRVRMYVRSNGQDICFRLWNTDDEDIWEKHGWVPYEAIRQASAMYGKGKAFDPNHAYDINVAKALIKEEEK